MASKIVAQRAKTEPAEHRGSAAHLEGDGYFPTTENVNTMLDCWKVKARTKHSHETWPGPSPNPGYPGVRATQVRPYKCSWTGWRRRRSMLILKALRRLEQPGAV